VKENHVTSNPKIMDDFSLAFQIRQHIAKELTADKKK